MLFRALLEILGVIMKIYIVQHGEAVPEDIDVNRPLSEKGKTDVLKTANFLKQAGIRVCIIWHSSKLRAKQTAQVMAEVISPQNGIREKPGLAPNDPVAGIKEEILKLNQEDLMLVSHLPFLRKLASLFLLGSESYSPVTFRQGGVVCLDLEENGIWSVNWMIIPDLIREWS
jgi:phosphohistidine phosphatase